MKRSSFIVNNLYFVCQQKSYDRFRHVLTGKPIMNKNGTIRIKLDILLTEKGVSKNKLSHWAEMQRTQINNYCKNKITRLDTDVLARICTALDCEIQDHLEFVPPSENDK